MKGYDATIGLAQVLNTHQLAFDVLYKIAKKIVDIDKFTCHCHRHHHRHRHRVSPVHQQASI